MNEADVMDGEVEDIPNLVVLVETPRWGDARFFGRWFLAVEEAQQAVEVALVSDPSLRKRYAGVFVMKIGKDKIRRIHGDLRIDAMLYMHYLVRFFLQFRCRYDEHGYRWIFHTRGTRPIRSDWELVPDEHPPKYLTERRSCSDGATVEHQG